MTDAARERWIRALAPMLAAEFGIAFEAPNITNALCAARRTAEWAEKLAEITWQSYVGKPHSQIITFPWVEARAAMARKEKGDGS